jgi:hypothetical protein
MVKVACGGLGGAAVNADSDVPRMVLACFLAALEKNGNSVLVRFLLLGLRKHNVL